MLVLSRKSGERVYVGNDITLVVVEVTGNRVRLGIDAPGNVKIVREELCDPLAVPPVWAERNRTEIKHVAGNP